MEKLRNIGDVQRTSLTTWKWTIRNYCNYFAKSRKMLHSPHFSALQSDDITNWRFEAYPNHDDEENKKYLTVLLTNLDDVDTTASCEFSILNENNDAVYKRIAFSQEVFSKRDLKTRGISHFVTHEFLNDKSNHALADNTLTLQFRFLTGPKFYSVPKKMEDDFEELVDGLKYRDLTLIVEEKELYVHKAMLAARSPVFAAMFQYNMQENQENIVRISDIKFNIVREMCHYIYAGEVNDIGTIAKDLLIAADKYWLEDLKVLCEKTMCNQLNLDNVLEYLQFSKTYNAEYLKPTVFQFVKTHIEIIYETPEFAKLNGEMFKFIIGIVAGI